MPAWMVQHVAAIASVDGVDVDATSPLVAWLAARAGTAENPYVPIRSVWATIDGFRSTRVRGFIDSTIQKQQEAPPLVIIVLPGNSTLRDLSRTFQPAVTTALGSHMAIGLSAASLRGGRPHLVQLGGIRRFAEEWELFLAIDLSGRFDPTWEAEAAIARVGERLSVLRMPNSAPSRTAVGRDRVACRALHAAIDRTERLDVALSSERPVPFPMTPRAAARAAERAAVYIAERMVIHTQALREGITRNEGTPSSRGF